MKDTIIVYVNEDHTCREKDCNNKGYRVDMINNYIGSMLCRKHFKMYQ